MSTPYKCPVCEGKQIVAQSFYDAGQNPQEMESCRSCGGTGIVWSPPTGDSGSLFIGKDVLVSGSLVSDGVYKWMKPEEMQSVDFVPEEGWPSSDYDTPQEEEGAPPDDSFESLATIAHMHPERQRVIDFLHTLPDDTPLMLLTPQALVEAIVSNEIVQLLVLSSSWDQSLYDQMVAYDERNRS